MKHEYDEIEETKEDAENLPVIKADKDIYDLFNEGATDITQTTPVEQTKDQPQLDPADWPDSSIVEGRETKPDIKQAFARDVDDYLKQSGEEETGETSADGASGRRGDLELLKKSRTYLSDENVDTQNKQQFAEKLNEYFNFYPGSESEEEAEKVKVLSRNGYNTILKPLDIYGEFESENAYGTEQLERGDEKTDAPTELQKDLLQEKDATAPEEDVRDIYETFDFWAKEKDDRSAEDAADVKNDVKPLRIGDKMVELPNFNAMDEKTVTDYSRALDERLERAEPEVHMLFDEYIDQIKIIDAEYTEDAANYNSRLDGIRMDISSDLDDPTGSGSVFFHEAGHMIDNYAGEGHSWLSDDAQYRQLIRNDVEDRVRATMERDQCSQEEAYIQVGTELEHYKAAGVSDIYGSVTGGQCQGFYGHDPNYWKIDGKVEKEAFANMFEASIGDAEKAELMREYLPNAYEQFIRIIKRR